MKRLRRLTIIYISLFALVIGSSVAVFAAPPFFKGVQDVEVKVTEGENGAQSEVELVLRFNDLQQAEWALKNIAKMQMKQVFSGYEDGSFRPNEPINQAQALTAAVRLLGLEAEAKARMNAVLQFKDAKQVYEKYPWAVGYVAVALENGLFGTEEDKVQPDKPASRIWTAVLLVKALKLENEAKAKMGAVLPFADRRDIPAGAVGYVAVAVEKGLFSGYEDNTFRPMKTITRAEMAALLDRLGSQLNLDNENPQGNEIKGVITAIDGSSVTIQSGSESYTLNLAGNLYIFLGKYEGSVHDLAVGNQVEVTANGSQAMFIDVKAEPVKAEGKVISVQNGTANSQSVVENVYLTILTDQNQTLTFQLEDETKVYLGKQLTGQSEINPDDRVKVTTVNKHTAAVEIAQRKDEKRQGKAAQKHKDEDHESKDRDEEGEWEAEGSIVSLSINAQGAGTITILTEDGETQTFTIDGNAEFEGKLGLLIPGAEVEVKGKNGIVTKIEID